MKKYNIDDINTAIKQIHFPDSFLDFNRARRRLVFEELFAMQLALLKLKNKYDVNKFKLSVKTRYLTDDVFKSSFVFGKDLIRENIKPSTLDKPTISEYYLSGWKYW